MNTFIHQEWLRKDSEELYTTEWQFAARWMTYSHLRADCLYTGTSSGPSARQRVLKTCQW